MARFFTSDTHFSHANILHLSNRPFESVGEMNETIIQNWNEMVGPEDTVYHLGDVALGPIAESLPLVSRLNGHKILVTGNHDRTFPPMQRDRTEKIIEWRQKYLDAGFSEIWERGDVKIGSINFHVCHFPYDGDSHDEERFSEYRLADFGTPLIHGHTHSNGVLSWSNRGTLQIHVGVDAWDFRPVHEEEILGLARADAFRQDERVVNL